MSKIIGITIALVAMIFTSSAEARSHRHVRHVQHYSHRVTVAQQAPQPDLFKMPLFGDVANYGSVPTYRKVAARAQRSERRMILAVNPREGFEQTRPQINYTSTSTFASGESEARPSDCYGIQWCGCFMRHYKGIADRGLNLARNWASVGSPTTPHAGAIVVWNHHVGELRSEIDAKGRALVYSGNNGSGNRATVRRQRVNNAIAFRSI